METEWKLGGLASLMALFIPPLIYICIHMNIYMYTVYTYLRVDIYECMSNVSITCWFRQFVSSPDIFVEAARCFCSAADYMYINIQT